MSTTVSIKVPSRMKIVLILRQVWFPVPFYNNIYIYIYVTMHVVCAKLCFSFSVRKPKKFVSMIKPVFEHKRAAPAQTKVYTCLAIGSICRSLFLKFTKCKDCSHKTDLMGFAACVIRHHSSTYTTEPVSPCDRANSLKHYFISDLVT